jgi:hypothetical protein
MENNWGKTLASSFTGMGDFSSHNSQQAVVGGDS